MSCPCYRCVQAEVAANPLPPELSTPGVDSRLHRMFLCETCGNKRCPHAADHRNACSGSNEPGQRGSLYEDVPWPPRDSGRHAERGDPSGAPAEGCQSGPSGHRP
jgi:hypothetical protein